MAEEELDEETRAQVEEALAEVTRPPTAEEIARVRRHDCAGHGHCWALLFDLDAEDPRAIACQRCGRSCTVTSPGG